MRSKEWENVKIGDICEINKNAYTAKDNWEFINYLDTGNITENKISNILKLDVAADKIPSRAKRKVFHGDIIYSTVRPNQKHYGIISKPLDNMLVSTGFAVLTGKQDKTDNLFLYYYLSQQYIVDMLHTIGEHSVSTYPAIKPSDIENLIALIPPVYEQKVIAATLSCLDDKIVLNNRINKNLEEIAQAIFKNWFVDFEPFQDGEFEDSELGLIPKEWRVVYFQDVFDFQEGPGIRNWQYVSENGIKFINIRCIQNNDLMLNTANMISIEEANGKYAHFMLREWDVVVSSSGTLGRYAIVRKKHLPLCLNTSVIRFTPKEKFENFSYMFGYLTSNEFYEHLITKASGSVQMNFGPMHLSQIKLLFPTNEVLNKYHEIVFPLIQKCIQVRNENEVLINIRDTLLPKLMSGEIRVPIEEVQ